MPAAFGHEMADIVDRVLVTDGKETRYMDKSEMMLTYRDSLFKKERKWIILKAELNFRGQFNPQLANDIASQKKYTQPLLSWSAGSVFKRKGDIMPARLIDELGLKGLTVGGAQISRVHSGFIVNASHHATCEDVMGLIEIIRNEIFRAYKIVPELEIELLGDC
jgi:UDP-N-acetylmuramate dehydrogenase